MTSDARAREPKRRVPRRAFVPEVIDVDIRRAHYDPPRVTYLGRERVLLSSAVEFVVTTSEEIPPRAETPALIVGDVAIPEYETVGRNRYAFIATEPGLEEGSPIALGWPDYPKTVRVSRFAYRSPKEPQGT